MNTTAIAYILSTILTNLTTDHGKSDQGQVINSTVPPEEFSSVTQFGFVTSGKAAEDIDLDNHTDEDIDLDNHTDETFAADYFYNGTTASGNGTDPNATTTAPISFRKVAENYWYFWFGVYLHNYYLPVITIIGIFGNILSFLIMIKPHNRRVSCCIYMAVLAVSDTSNLYVAGHYWLVTGGAAPLVSRGIYNSECQILAYFFQTFQFNGVLLIIFMTFDRFIAIRYPFKAAVMCTPRRAKITSACIVLFSSVFELPYYFLSSATAKHVCAALSVSKGYFTVAYAWINTCLNCFIPFIILLFMNGTIIATTRKRSKYFVKDKKADGDKKKDKAQEEKEKAQRRTERQLTISLLIVTFTFLALSLPQYIRYTTYSFISPSTAKSYADYILAAHITNKLYFTNNAVNFFLYCMGGSRFRHDLSVLLGCGRCGPKETPRPTGSTVSTDTQKTNA